MVVLACACACGGGPPPSPPPPLPVDLVTLAPTRVVDSTEYLAELRSRRETQLRPRVQGYVQHIYARPGQVVVGGQPLVQLDPGRQPVAVEQAQATRAAREAQLALAARNLERARVLVEAGAFARQQLDDARATYDAARADVEALGAQVAGSKVDLSFYRIEAPGPGVVGDIPVRVGDLVTPDTLITTVTDNRVLETYITIPVERARDVRLGTEVQLVDDSGRLVGEAAVDFISPVVGSQTQSVLIKANVSNPKGTLRSEQEIRARVVWRAREGVTVPALAVVRVSGQPFVYVAERRDHGLVARQRPVTLGELTDNAFVVEKGVGPGDQVVTSNVQKLRDGAAIAPAAAQPRPGEPRPGAKPRR